MPLAQLQKGTEAIITMNEMKNATKKFLEGLGILPGSKVVVVSGNNGNLIISVKGTRLAIDKDVAQRVHVEVNHAALSHQPALAH